MDRDFTRLWILVQVYLALSATGFSPTVFHHCCDIGKQWHENSDGACPLYRVGDANSKSQGACSLVVDICCLGHLRTQLCLRGRKAAIQGQSCQSVPEASRECCGCCQLGSTAADAGLPCQAPNHFGSECRDAFVHCCQNKPQNIIATSSVVIGNHVTHQSPPQETDVDKCLQFHGRLCSQMCINQPSGYRCECHQGYELQADRRTCKPNGASKNMCAENPCDQMCRPRGSGIECICHHGYRLSSDGRTCEDVNECYDTVVRHNCSSQQRCVNTFGGFTCQSSLAETASFEDGGCPPGHTWNAINRRCEDMDECSSGRHRCVPGTTCINTKGSYNCVFLNATLPQIVLSPTRRPTRLLWLTTPKPFHVSWPSPLTATRSESAFQVKTRSRPQLFRRTLLPQADGRCGPGFSLNHVSRQCEDVDECLMEGGGCPLSNMVCRNTIGSFACTCSTGYRFNPRSQICEDIDECRAKRHDCMHYEVCENSIGSYVCRPASGNCSRGYVSDHRTGQCTDIDECSQPRKRCGTGSICINTPGSFRCQTISCKKGMRPDSTGSCADIDECRENPEICSSNQECRNTPGSYVCWSTISCGIGYEINAQGTKCLDINECERGRHNCNGTLMSCVNRPGTYICQCPDGYQMNHATHSCEDVDECHKFGGHVCAQNARCENSPGSFRCICQEGFQLEPHSRYCSDINECLRSGLCEHTCRNTWGSYYCSCNDGYQLSRDGRTCSDVDECNLWRDSSRSTDFCRGLCHNIPGSYLCSCPIGYQMATDGRTCKDVDECNLGLAACHDPDEVCVNTGGRYECRLVICPLGFVKTPKLDSHLPQPRHRSRGSSNEQSYDSHGTRGIQGRFVRESPSTYGIYSHPHPAPISATTTLRPFPSNILRGVVAQPILFLSNEDSGVVCQKVECAANDIGCVLNLTKSIQWQHVSLPSIPFVSDPIVIVNVQTIAASVHPNNEFAIVSGNDLGIFDVIKKPGFGDRGEVRLLKPIKGPSEHTLTLRMDNYNRYHNIISQHIAHIVINVSQYAF